MDIEYKISAQPVPYEEALAWMENRVASIIAGDAGACVWFLEHPPLYTAGTSAKPDGLLDKDKLPVYMTGRGGEYTYHGPGQLVAYVMLDLKQLFAPQAPDLRAYIARLEAWIIQTLADFGVQSFIREGRVGVWVDEGAEAKIAAIGVRVKKWVAFHGVCINVAPNLEDYRGIVPCGIAEYGVTSLAALGKDSSMQEIRLSMQENISALLLK